MMVISSAYRHHGDLQSAVPWLFPPMHHATTIIVSIGKTKHTQWWTPDNMYKKLVKEKCTIMNLKLAQWSRTHGPQAAHPKSISQKPWNFAEQPMVPRDRHRTPCRLMKWHLKYSLSRKDFHEAASHEHNQRGKPRRSALHSRDRTRGQCYRSSHLDFHLANTMMIEDKRLTSILGQRTTRSRMRGSQAHGSNIGE